jgi:hypothetical protein
VAKSHPEEGRYLCRFHPCNEISARLYEIFETSKKQDLTPFIAFIEEKMLAVKGKNKQKGLLVGNPAQPAQQELLIF